MDLHRCRFVPYPPSAINAIAVPYQESTAQCTARNSKTTRVAIGRANGNVEIWNPANGQWIQESTMYGGQDRSIDGLVWVADENNNNRLRLFSIGGSSAVTEWDIERGRPKRHAQGQHGEIWCIAAQPPRANKQGSSSKSTAETPKLVVGTLDGELAMYNIEDGDLQFERKVLSPAKKKKKAPANIVSVAFQHPDIVLAGCSDSSILVCDIRRGIQLRTLSLGSDTSGGAKDIIVWAIKAIPTTHGFVTGDSTGTVCIWHHKTYTIMQKIQAHDQDILSLAISLDGLSIMSGGMDRRAVLIRKPAANERFGKVWGRRYHEHDVKALASLETAQGISVCISGGPDASPVVIPLREHGKEAHRTLSNLPHTVPVTSAPKARFIVGWWGREIHLWQLRQSFGSLLETEEDGEAVENNHKLLKTIVIRGEASITSVVINDIGTLLVVATTAEVKAFALSHDTPAKSSDVEVTQIPLPESIARAGATMMQLSPVSNTLCLVQDRARILVSQISNGEVEGDGSTALPVFSPARTVPRKLRTEGDESKKLGPLGYFERGIKLVAFSEDGDMLAAADLAGYVDTWVLSEKANSDEKSESGDDSSDDESDSSPQWISNPAKQIPRLSGQPVMLSFTNTIEESGKNALLVMTCDWQVALLHPHEGMIAPWTKRNPWFCIPNELARTLDLVKGVVWVGPRAWFYGNVFVGMIDFSKDLPIPKHMGRKGGDKKSLKRKRGLVESGAGRKLDEGRLGPKKVQLASNGKKKWKELDQDGTNGKHAESMATTDDEQYDDDEDDDEDDDAADARAALELIRSQYHNSNNNNNTTTTTTTTTKNGKKPKGKAWWVTYRYRPILGIVPLGVTDAEGKLGLEAALIERPKWDIDLGDRFVAEGEREGR